MVLRSYKELIVWQKAIELVEEIYALTRLLPRDELYGLISQMRRSAVSIPSNIAEGYKRRGLGEYIRFLCIADGSGAELETQLIIAQRQFPSVHCERSLTLLDEVQRMLTSMIQKLENKRV